jgi:transcriptional regulator with PAS, ATPase and Fis domain
LLAQHFIKKFSGNVETKTASQDAMKMLMSYSWPGNIRQLENAIERAVALLGTRNIILSSDLPAEIQDSKTNFLLSDVFIPDEGIDLYGRIALLEKELILQSLEKTGGNKNQAAKLLNLKRTTLIEKLRRFDLSNDSAAEKGHVA